MDTTKLSTKVWHDPIYFIAFGFGTGLMRVAPGTWGTVAAIPVYLLIAKTSPLVYLLFTIAAFAFGVFVSDKVSQDLGVHDYGGIVWDEVVGYLLTLFMVPVGFWWMLLGFVLFRIFDIWKPQPIGWVDKHVHGGLGIMLDDVIAAIFAGIILQCVVWIAL